jgi:putative transcription factor
MGTCDMCGAESYLLKARIEGTELNVCKNCSKYGKVLERPRTTRKPKFKRPEPKPEPAVMQLVVEDYSNLIKKAREKMDLKQEELAKKLNEKESLIHHMESGEFKPSIALAKKLERFFHIKLIEKYEEKSEFSARRKAEDVTIGDFIKIKKK